jgi:haloalkane dehalogenase
MVNVGLTGKMRTQERCDMAANRRQFLQWTGQAVACGALSTLTQASDSTLLGSFAGSATLTASEYRATLRMARTASGRIAYVERGRGKVALFLHGFPLNSYQWRGLIERVSHRRRCIAPDFLGLGYTEVGANHSVAPSAQVAMLTELLDSLSVHKVDVVANDSGGAIAQLLVAKHPERVRSLLFTNCDTEPDSPPAAVLPVIELARAGKFADAWLAPWVADKVLARSPKGLGGIAFTYPERLSDQTIDYYLGPLVSSPQRKALVNAYAIGLDPNPLAGVEPALKHCSAPARIVWGTGDDIFSQASPQYLDRILPKSRGVRSVLGAKLFFPEEFPELIAEEALKLWGV